MLSLFIYLLPIAVLDSLNPTTTAVQIYLLSTPKPVARSVSFIAGVFITYWAAGLAVASGVSQLSINFLTLPRSASYLLQLIIGVVLFVVGWKLNHFSGHAGETKLLFRLTIIRTFLFGSAATLWDFPTALPYLAAIERIVRADFDTVTTMIILAIYNLIFVLPLLVLLSIYLVLGQQSTNLIRHVHQLMQKWGREILQFLLLGLGTALILDCIAYYLDHPIFE